MTIIHAIINLNLHLKFVQISCVFASLRWKPQVFHFCISTVWIFISSCYVDRTELGQIDFVFNVCFLLFFSFFFRSLHDFSYGLVLVSAFTCNIWSNSSMITTNLEHSKETFSVFVSSCCSEKLNKENYRNICAHVLKLRLY